MDASSAPDSRRLEDAALILMMLDAPGIGPRRLLDMLSKLERLDAVVEYMTSGSNVPARVREFMAATSRDEYVASLDRTVELGGDFKLWDDDDYPTNLSRWDGRPPVLFYKGDLSRLGDKALALVGRVDPTDGGAEAANRFGRLCVDNGITVVSGLAKGIDAASHRAALTPPSGYTYAVVGHGLDYVYPRENEDLYGLIPQHGAIISQFPTGVGPQRWTFPARNEVMCTLALGTVIIEGKTGCGSIIQADFSFKHGRPVFLLSRNLRAPDSSWAHDLVERGAVVVEQFDQVMDVVDHELRRSWRSSPPSEKAALFDIGHRPEAKARHAVSDRMPTAVLFDLDGVVVDSRDATATALADIASRHTGESIAPTDVQVLGKPHETLAILGVQRAYEVYRAEYDDAFRRARGEIAVFEDVVRGIMAMRAKGIRIGAVTAQPARRASLMLPGPVRDLFDVFLCYNETRGRKDVGIGIALEKLGVPRQNAIFIGDQPTDLEAAHKAGVKGVGVLWGFAAESELRRWPHDVLLVDPWEVRPDLVASLVP